MREAKGPGVRRAVHLQEGAKAPFLVIWFFTSVSSPRPHKGSFFKRKDFEKHFYFSAICCLQSVWGWVVFFCTTLIRTKCRASKKCMCQERETSSHYLNINFLSECPGSPSKKENIL